MSNFISEYLKEKKLRRKLQRFFEPDKNFMAGARANFLNLAAGRFGAEARPAAAVNFWTVFRYGLISVLAIVFMGSAAAVYADQANVDLNHPLYPLKLVGESIRVALADNQTKAAVHVELAERRLAELNEVKEEAGTENEVIEQNATNTPVAVAVPSAASPKTKMSASVKAKMEKLNKDVDKEIESALDAASQQKMGKAGVARLCDDLNASMEKGSANLPQDLKQKQDEMRQNLEKKCEQTQENIENGSSEIKNNLK